MSTPKHVLEVTPPEHQQIRETYKFYNYKCPVCNGQGHFMSEQVGYDEFVSPECDYCEGTGKVKAEVEIKWSPDFD